jgi:hypothetical protein
MPDSRWRERISRAVARERGGIRMSTIAPGACIATALSSSSPDQACAAHLHRGAPADRGDALADARAVAGDHDAHGSYAVIMRFSRSVTSHRSTAAPDPWASRPSACESGAQISIRNSSRSRSRSTRRIVSAEIVHDHQEEHGPRPDSVNLPTAS